MPSSSVHRASAPLASALLHMELEDVIVFWVKLSFSYVETKCSPSKQWSEAASGVHKENVFGLHVAIKQYRGCISIQCCVTAQKENIFFKCHCNAEMILH